MPLPSPFAIPPRASFDKEVADRVVFMADGEIVEVGTPAEIFDSPQEERTKKFLAQIL
jgi:ABC-type polar amino acid transport system ATPase subunit